MNDGLVKILDGNTFVVSDDRGDIEASLTDPTGLFSYDTRFLSKWILTIDDQRLNALSVDDRNIWVRTLSTPPRPSPLVSFRAPRCRSTGKTFRHQTTGAPVVNFDRCFQLLPPNPALRLRS